MSCDGAVLMIGKHNSLLFKVKDASPTDVGHAVDMHACMHTNSSLYLKPIARSLK